METIASDIDMVSCRVAWRAIRAVRKVTYLALQVNYEVCDVYSIEYTVAVDISSRIVWMLRSGAKWAAVNLRMIANVLAVTDSINNIQSVGYPIAVNIARNIIAACFKM